MSADVKLNPKSAQIVVLLRIDLEDAPVLQEGLRVACLFAEQQGQQEKALVLGRAANMVAQRINQTCHLYIAKTGLALA